MSECMLSLNFACICDNASIVRGFCVCASIHVCVFVTREFDYACVYSCVCVCVC